MRIGASRPMPLRRAFFALSTASHHLSAAHTHQPASATGAKTKIIPALDRRSARCTHTCYIRTQFIHTSVMRFIQNRMMARVKQGIRTTCRPPAQRHELASECASCKDVAQRIVIYSQAAQHSQRRFWMEPGGKGRFGRIALLLRGRRGCLHREPPCAAH